MKLGAALIPVLLTTSVSTAFAQAAPVAGPAETSSASGITEVPSTAPGSSVGAPPQTHGWNEVSHVNGQLVKVGESNEYLKTFRKTNIASNPIGWMAGFFGVSASHALSDNIAIRGDINHVDAFDEDDMKFWEISVGLPLYLKRTYQGAFIEPGIMVRGMTETNYQYHDVYDDQGNWVSSTTTETEQTETVAGPQMLFGWHLTWDSGFNVAAAVGLGRDLSTKERTEDDDYDNDHGMFFNGYFRVGYAF